MSNESEIRNEVILHGKISAMVQIIEGTQETPLVPVTIRFPMSVTISDICLPPGVSDEQVILITDTTLRIPAASVLVIYATCNGGTSLKPVYISASATGDLTCKKLYGVNSSSSSTRGVGIFVITTGKEGGEVNISRNISGGAIM